MYLLDTILEGVEVRQLHLRTYAPSSWQHHKYFLC